MARTSLYQLLFGKEHITDGNVIDMAEHGRTGGTTSGDPFKVIGEVSHTTLIEKKTSGSDTINLIGKTRTGATETDLEWQLVKITSFASNASLTHSIEHPGGNSNYTSAWVSRASLSYS